jgi:formamidopyrimidine-DNA glycosylase
VPELPEVEVVRSGLAPAVTGATVLGVTVLDDRALTRHPDGGAHFEAALTGRVIRSAARRGKFLWLPLENASGEEPSEAVVGHLGMSGQLLLRAPGAAPERHERVRIDLSHPRHGEVAVVFADQRTFGSLAIDALVPTRWRTSLATPSIRPSRMPRSAALWRPRRLPSSACSSIRPS